MKRKNQFNENWNEIFNFPKINGYLVEEKKRRKELIKNNYVHDKIQTQEENDKILKKFDNKINITRILNKDLRYLGVGRNKPMSKFFDQIVMHRILIDASKIIKYQNEPERCEWFYNSSLANMKVRLEEAASCPRYSRHVKDYERREYFNSFNTLPDENINNNEQLTLFDPNNPENNLDNNTNIVNIVTDATNTTELTSNSAAFNDIQPENNETNQQQQQENNLKSKSTDTLNSSLLSKPVSVIKPKNQTVSTNLFKLPSINKK